MTDFKLTAVELVEFGVLGTVLTGIGAGTGAALRGGSMLESASIVGLGSGLLTAGVGFFYKVPAEKPSLTKAISSLAFTELAGAAIGYIGTKLFINTATSPIVFADAVLGFPVTVGTWYCLGLLTHYYQNQNSQRNTPKLHSR